MILGLLVIFAMWTCSTRDRLHRSYETTGVFKLDMRVPKTIHKPKKHQVTRRWRLDVPNVYIRNWGGHNKNKIGQSLFMNLRGKLDPVTSVILPYPTYRAQIESSAENKVSIKIKTGGGAKGLGAGQCMRYHDYTAKVWPNRRKRKCEEHKALCPVIMQVDGWNTSFSVDRKYYDNVQPVCDAVRALLDAMTVERDSLFDNNEISE